MVIYLERGADLHMAQRIPLPLTVSCFSKIQIGFTFLVPAHPGSPGQRPLNSVCVCVWSQAEPVLTCTVHVEHVLQAQWWHGQVSADSDWCFLLLLLASRQHQNDRYIRCQPSQPATVSQPQQCTISSSLPMCHAKQCCSVDDNVARACGHWPFSMVSGSQCWLTVHQYQSPPIYISISLPQPGSKYHKYIWKLPSDTSQATTTCHIPKMTLEIM